MANEAEEMPNKVEAEGEEECTEKERDENKEARKGKVREQDKVEK